LIHAQSDTLLINNSTTEHCPNMSVRFRQRWRNGRDKRIKPCAY